MSETINTIGRSDVMGRDGFTWWIGEVESIEDPQELGRVKVRIIGWYTGAGGKEAYTASLPTVNLPWAICILPTDQPGIKNTGTTTELQVGAQVLGFFLDGEEAQLPCVLGSFRGFRNAADQKTGSGDANDSDVPKTTVADGTEAPKLPTQAQDAAGKEVPGGAPFNKTGTAPANPSGAEATDRGALPAAAQAVPGNYASNPQVPPSEAQAIADGAQGPAAEGFERDLERMLSEVGTFAAGLGSDPAGNLVSLITGKKVNNKILKNAIKGINLFIANGISGIMSWMKEVLAKQIEKIISAITKFITNIIPLGIINAILQLADFIFSLFCGFEGKWIISLVRDAFNSTAAFSQQISNFIVQKVYDAIPAQVKSTVTAIVQKVQKGIQQVMQLGRTLLAAIRVVKNVAGQFKEMGKAMDTLFQFDFSKINWGNLVTLIINLLKALLPKKDCGRKIRGPKLTFWLPLLGSSDCSTVPEFLQRKVEINAGNVVSQGDYISSLYQNLLPNAMQVTTYMNGASIIQDNNPGKEKTIVTDAGGQTKISTAQGDTHYNQPGNETKIVGGDKCTTIKGNHCVTVEGDYTLKVMGDFNLEILGAKNEHCSNGVGVQGKDGTQPGDKQAKSAQTIAADHEINYQGNWGIQAANVTLSAINSLDLNASSMSVKATSLMNSISGEIVNECAWETNLVNNVVFNMIGMLNPLPGISGRLSIIKGADVTLTTEGLASALPATQVRMTVSTAQPGGIVDVVTGATGGHGTLVTCASGGIGEFVTGGGGAIINQVTSGAASYSVGTGIMSLGCAVGPCQIYGLPLLLN